MERSLWRPDDRERYPTRASIDAHIMKPSSHVDVCPTSSDVFCTTSPSDASRFIAWVSLVGSIAWGSCLVAMVGSGANVGSNGISLLLFIVTIYHVGQALASTISFKHGAWFARVALAAQSVIATAVLIGNTESANILALLTTPLICSVCALIVARRHSAFSHHEDVG